MRRRNMHLNASPIIFKHAQELRDKETEAEKILWIYLCNKQMEGMHFRRQHPARKFAIDFYTNEIKLGIEVDGEYHETREQKFYDEDRDEILESYDFVLLRFTNDQVINSTQSVLDEIRRTIRLLKKFYSE